MSFGTAKATIGRAIDRSVGVAIAHPLTRRVIPRIPVRVRRWTTRTARRLRRAESARHDFTGPLRPWGITAHVVDARIATCRVSRPLVGQEAVRVSLGANIRPVHDLVMPFGYEGALRSGFAAFRTNTTRLDRRVRRSSGVRWRAIRTNWFPGASDRVDDAELRLRSNVFRNEIQRFLGVLDDRSSYPDQTERAHLLASSAAAGTPVVVRPEHAATLRLPDQVVQVMSSATIADLLDEERRHAVAYRQWSTTLDHLSMRAVWSSVLDDHGVTHDLRVPVPMSVLIATRRPAMIARWLPQVIAQTYPAVQLCIALHGDAFGPGHIDRVGAELRHAGVDHHIVAVDDSQPLGAVLQRATERADGTLVVKWDDDDLYASTHLADLARTHDYSGAQLVGKACDFVYLRGRDLTVRRRQADRETFSRTMAGGTLCIRRDDLDAVGGWPSVSSGVDVGLVAAVQSSGALAYRSIGFGYMMIREPEGSGHTWVTRDDHFLGPGVPRRSGLCASWALVDVGADVRATLEGVTIN